MILRLILVIVLITFLFSSCVTAKVKKYYGPKNTSETTAALFIDAGISYGLITKTIAVSFGYVYGSIAVCGWVMFMLHPETRWIQSDAFYQTEDSQRIIILRHDGIVIFGFRENEKDIYYQTLCRRRGFQNCQWRYGIRKSNFMLLDTTSEHEGDLGTLVLEENESRMVWRRPDESSIIYLRRNLE